MAGWTARCSKNGEGHTLKRKHVGFDGRGDSEDAVTAELSDIDTDDLERLIH